MMVNLWIWSCTNVIKKSSMILDTLKHVRFSALWQLLRLSFRHLRFLYPTYLATKECMAISTSHFGRKHYQNGPANAFRHALWNYLIAKKCTNKSKNTDRVLFWTKSITDWHEIAFANRDLAKRMDFHNNTIGRNVFLENPLQPLEKVIAHFLELTVQSIKINSDSDLTQYRLSLVHLTDD